MATQFYHVQIPYRGVVPVINRRGPFPDIQLTREQIELLRNEFKVELLDPRTGKEFHYPKPAGGMEFKDLPPKADDVPDPPAVEPEAPVTAVTVATNVVPVVPEPAPEPEQDDSEEPGDDPVSEKMATAGIPEFDHTQFPNYSGMTKSAKKQLRAEYAEAVSKGMSPEEFYAKKKAAPAPTAVS